MPRPSTLFAGATLLLPVGMAFGVHDLLLNGTTTVLLTLAALVGIWQANPEGGVVFRWLGLFGTWVVLRALTGPSLYLGFLEVTRVVPLILLVGVVPERSRVLAGMLVAAGVGAAFGLVDLAQSAPMEASWVDPQLYRNLTFRLASVFVNPNLFGIYTAPFFVYGLARYLEDDGDRRVWGSIALIHGAMTLMTFSRAAWLAAGVGAVVATGIATIPRRDRVRRLGLLLLLSLPLWLIVGAAVTERFSHTSDGSALGVHQRRELYRGVLSLCRDHGLVGVGTNAFELVFPRYRTLGGYYPREAHSDVLQITSELGVVGLALFVLPLLVLIRRGLGSPTAPDRAAAAALVTFATNALLVSSWRYLFLKVQVFGWMILLAPSGTLTASGRDARLVRGLGTPLLLGGLYLWGVLALAGAGLPLRSASRFLPFADDLVYLRAREALARRDPRSAEHLLLEALALNPHQSRYHMDLGILRLAQGRLDAAESAIGRARALDPLSEENRLFAARIRAARGDRAGAIGLLRSALETNEQYLELNRVTYPRIYRDLVVLLRQEGRHREAQAVEAEAAERLGADFLPPERGSYNEHR